MSIIFLFSKIRKSGEYVFSVDENVKKHVYKNPTVFIVSLFLWLCTVPLANPARPTWREPSAAQTGDRGPESGWEPGEAERCGVSGAACNKWARDTRGQSSAPQQLSSSHRQSRGRHRLAARRPRPGRLTADRLCNFTILPQNLDRVPIKDKEICRSERKR